MNILDHNNDPPDNLKSLSPRERDVLEGLATGKSYKMIAEELGISPNTMPTLIRRLYKKLGVKSATEAVYKAYLSGRG